MDNNRIVFQEFKRYVVSDVEQRVTKNTTHGYTAEVVLDSTIVLDERFAYKEDAVRFITDEFYNSVLANHCVPGFVLKQEPNAEYPDRWETCIDAGFMLDWLYGKKMIDALKLAEIRVKHINLLPDALLQGASVKRMIGALERYSITGEVPDEQTYDALGHARKGYERVVSQVENIEKGVQDALSLISAKASYPDGPLGLHGKDYFSRLITALEALIYHKNKTPFHTEAVRIAKIRYMYDCADVVRELKLY